jgi:signal recognition particle receptor subunit beta
MRIGEIVVIGPSGAEGEEFIRSVCQEVERGDETICFGKFPINKELVVHLYGIEVEEDARAFSWDLISKKMMGLVVLFNWYQEDPLAQLSPTLDFFSSHCQTPMVIAANIGEGQVPIPQGFYNGGISIAQDTKFTFCQVKDSKSVREVLVTLIDILIDKV